MKRLCEEFGVVTLTTCPRKGDWEIYKSHLAGVPHLLDNRPYTCTKSKSYICEKSTSVTNKLQDLYFRN
jgi:hypothetical protein